MFTARGYASWRRAAALLLAVGGASVCAPSASAATKEWKRAEGGTFGLTSGWTPNGVPAAGDVARFDLDGSYTLRFDQDRQNRKLLIGDDKLVMELGKFDYRLVQSTGPSIVMGVQTSDVARLTVKDGQLQSGAAILAAAGKSAGSVVVAGDGSWDADGPLTVGQRGTGNITIAGSVSADSLKIGDAGGSRGSILLSGKNASLSVEQGGVVGNGAKAAGTLVVRADTAASFGGGLTINRGGDVRLEGGTLSAGKLVHKAGGKFTFMSGTLNLGKSNLLIGGDGLLGDALTLTLDKAVNVARTTRVDAGALLDLRNGKFTSGETVNEGTIRLRGAKSVLGGTRVTNAGAIAVVDSAVRVAAALVQDGTFSTTPAGTSIFAGAVSGAGHFTGGGTLRFESTYTPGAFDDFVRVTGDVEFAPAADLVLAAGGNDERARLRVFGDAVLGDVVVNLDLANLEFGVPITLVRATTLSRSGQLIVNGLDADEYDIVESGTTLTLIPHAEEPRFASFGSFAAVPEPGMLGGLGLAAIALMRRRRR